MVCSKSPPYTCYFKDAHCFYSLWKFSCTVCLLQLMLIMMICQSCWTTTIFYSNDLDLVWWPLFGVLGRVFQSVTNDIMAWKCFPDYWLLCLLVSFDYQSEQAVEQTVEFLVYLRSCDPRAKGNPSSTFFPTIIPWPHIGTVYNARNSM